jgi:hypothetical protein
MSYPQLLQLLRAELGPDAAQRLDARIRDTFGAQKIYIPTRARLDPEQIQSATAQSAPVAHVARKLGVSVRQAYRLIR